MSRWTLRVALRVVLVLIVALVLVPVTGCRGGQAREGRAAMESGDLVRAEAAWRAVLVAEPQNAEALEGLGWTWQLAGQPEEARRSFDQCLALHPDQPGCLRGMAATATAEGNTAAARRWLEAALRAAPGDLKVRHSLGLLELATGQPESALGRFEALVQEAEAAGAPRSEFLQAQAEAMLALGRAEAAAEAAGRAVDTAESDRRRALALTTRARALAAMTADRVNRDDCAGTAPAVLAVLEEADRNLDRVLALGVPLPELSELRRQVQRRRSVVDDLCPGFRTGQSGGQSGGQGLPG